MAFGWRYQIPFLASLGLRVVAPDMMGYSGTDAPDSLTFYTYKRAADDLAALAKELGLSSIILGGHDCKLEFAASYLPLLGTFV